MELIFVSSLSDRSFKLLYEFTIKNMQDWKNVFNWTLSRIGAKPEKQGTMSDYEYFVYLERMQSEFFDSQKYLLVNGDTPIVSGSITNLTEHIRDIGFMTDIRFRRCGYATLALSLVERNLFNNPNIYFTTITDKSDHHISRTIALKSGYIYDKETDKYVKLNPNKKIEEITDKPPQM